MVSILHSKSHAETIGEDTEVLHTQRLRRPGVEVRRVRKASPPADGPQVGLVLLDIAGPSGYSSPTDGKYS